MKLPEDKQARMKVLILIAIGTVAVLYVAQLGVKSLRKSKKAKTARLQELEEQQKKATLEIRRMPRDLELNRETVKKIKEISDKFVLKPVLGNYLLKAREIIEQYAKKLDIVLEDIREAGISQVPRRRGRKTDRTFHIYTARVTLDCGFHDIARFLREIKSSNPYLCVASLEIAGRPKEPEEHKITFDVQWPIWADYEMPGRLEEQLKEEEGEEEDVEETGEES